MVAFRESNPAGPRRARR